MGKNEILMTFGKYKFQSIEKVFNDKYYYNWIIKQNFFKVQYPKLYNALKNYEEKPKYIEQKKTPIRKDINFEQLPDDIKQLIFTKRYELMKLDKQVKLKHKEEHKYNYKRVLYYLKEEGFMNLWFLTQKWRRGSYKENNIMDLLEIGLREKFYKCYNYRYRNRERNTNINKLEYKTPFYLIKYQIIDYNHWHIMTDSDSDSDSD